MSKTKSAKTYYMNRQKRFKRITVDLPRQLYKQFRESPFRRNATNDSEGVRTALANVLNLHTESQQKNVENLEPHPIAGSGESERAAHIAAGGAN